MHDDECSSTMMRMRINLKIALCLLVFGAFFTTVSYWTKCGEAPVSRTSFSVFSSMTKAHTLAGKFGPQELTNEIYGEELDNATPGATHLSKDPGSFAGLEEIGCLINGEYTISCRRDDQDVYVPFTFLRKYFEVYGKVATVDGLERLEWQHSYSKYFQPKAKYDPKGVFMNFENFNVEARERVKCISAIDGVPVSTQWDIRGYQYPIQIAQFALSHFSKNLTETNSRVILLEDGLSRQAKWSTPDGMVRREWDPEANSHVLHFSTTESLQSVGISLALDQMQDLVLSLDFRLQSNGSFTVTLEDRERRERYFVHYVCSQLYISAEGNHIYYGMGQRRRWGRLTRDLGVDLRKGLGLAKPSRKSSKAHLRIRLIGLTLRGRGLVDNLTVSSAAHTAHFVDATEWLLDHQDANGGWAIPVERKFNSAGMNSLLPGWYSAMAQGQAMSALGRAYHATGDRRYLEAAYRATKPFESRSEDHGVMARFLDKYVWYEEYPTIPSSFVLNGFIYSLIGLYDVKMAYGGVDDERSRSVALLYEEGMKSLKALLPFFDSGVGSFYDLRHFTSGVAPNLARWDYHTTHIGQLLLLATIDDAPILKSTAERWIEYMKGKRAPHN